MRATSLFAGGGIALMLANVIYARMLEPADFGRLIFVQSIAFVSMGILPFGFDTLIVRKELAAARSTLLLLIVASLVIAVAIVTFAHFYFNVELPLLLYGVMSSVAGAATRLFAAVEQSQSRFLRSLVIAQAPLLIFFAGAIYHLFHGLPSWHVASILFAACYATGAAAGYLLANTDKESFTPFEAIRNLWLPALAFMGIHASLLFLNQMERLVAAGAIGMRELGALGLATTLIGSPYRLLSAGVGYTLMPRLKACNTNDERRRLVKSEIMIALAFGIPGAVVLFFIVPPIVANLFRPEYEITLSLVIALLILGLVRLHSGVVSTTVNSLGNTNVLHQFNLTGWLSVAVAAAAALGLQGFGSTGIVAGVTLGWIVRIALGGMWIRKTLK